RYDGRLLREVALKIFPGTGVDPCSPEAAARRDAVVAEARALCRGEHPGVVRFLAVVRDDARDGGALAMERVRGPSLHAVLQQRGPLPLGEILDAGVDVAWALSAVHDAGLLHRDVKPGNVLQGPHGHRLIDFGIVVEAVDGTAPEVPPLVGTIGYVAPECLS